MSEKGGSPPCFDSAEEPLELWAEGYGFGEVPDGVRVFAVEIDLVTENGVTTSYTAYRTGGAGRYKKDAVALLVGENYEPVSRAAVALVECAESLLDAFAPAADAVAPPAPGYARFHLITDRGRYYTDETVEALNNDTGNLPALTAAANALFYELRVLNERMQRADGGERDRQ